jgi:hypothetical protein
MEYLGARVLGKDESGSLHLQLQAGTATDPILCPFIFLFKHPTPSPSLYPCIVYRNRLLHVGSHETEQSESESESENLLLTPLKPLSSAGATGRFPCINFFVCR